MRPDAIKTDRREGGARSKRHQATQEQDINLEHGLPQKNKKKFFARKKIYAEGRAGGLSLHSHSIHSQTRPSGSIQLRSSRRFPLSLPPRKISEPFQ
jgi:hypothetical protein